MSNDRLKFRARFKNLETGKDCWQHLSLCRVQTFQDQLPGAGWLQMTDWGQWTGLYDSDGEMIWEGDMVKAASQGSRAVLEVKWGGGRAGFFLYRKFGGLVWNLSGGGKDYDQETITVIGNIYENPDLLDA